jgi:hypothetical protein
MSSMFDYRISRPVTSELIDLAEEGVISWKDLAIDMMNWVEEREVQQMAEANGLLVDEDL